MASNSAMPLTRSRISRHGIGLRLEPPKTDSLLQTNWPTKKRV